MQSWRLNTFGNIKSVGGCQYVQPAHCVGQTDIVDVARVGIARKLSCSGAGAGVAQVKATGMRWS